MQLKIINNTDTELCEEAEKQLRENKEKYGKRYCPCKILRNEETVCPCREFREQAEPGPCHCGRYEKIQP